VGDVYGIAVTQGALAGLLVQQGQPDAAHELYTTALTTLERIGDVHEAATVRSALASLVVQLGRPREALAFYETSLAAVEQLEDRRGQAVIAHAMAVLLRQMGNRNRRWNSISARCRARNAWAMCAGWQLCNTRWRSC
jgi:tetratricopeptide (TPR) repeat protein